MASNIFYYGIIEGQGRVVSLSTKGSVNTLIIDSSQFPEEVHSGEEIAVNGVCLTIQSINGSLLTFQLWPSTLEKTNLGHLTGETTVNLERNRNRDYHIK